MKSSKRLWRSSLFIILITALCGGLAIPLLAPARAAPQMQACVGTDITIAQWTFAGSVTTPSTGPGTFTAGSSQMSSVGTIGSQGNPAPSLSAQNWSQVESIDANAYYQFAVPTNGYNAIRFNFDANVSNNNFDKMEIRYSTDGNNYNTFSTITTLTTTFTAYISDMSSITGLENNSLTSFRIYGFSADSGSRALRVDNVTIIGNCMAPADLTSTAALNLTNTAVANLTGTAASNLTGTAVANSTGTAASNLTNTAIANLTGTATPTRTGTATNTSPPSATGIVISEFRTKGPSGASDEFVEIYNPTFSPIDVSGWLIRASNSAGTTGTRFTFPANTILQPGQHFIATGSAYSGLVRENPIASLSGTGITDDGGIAITLADGTTIIDQVGMSAGSAYGEGGRLTPLNINLNRSYDRKSGPSGSCVDSNNNAADFLSRIPSDPQSSSSPLMVCSNPTLTPTATPRRTATPRPTPTRTLSPPPPPPLVAINEFVPRPGSDWNNDGVVNVEDEYVELINHGTIPVSLSGYSLDDEVNIGSNPYRLPAITISPGERIVFYGSETALLLGDGGDGVRLLRPNGQLADAYNYNFVRFPDQSFCRLPDNGGLDDWNTNCFPTPGLQNALSGSFVSPPNVVDADLLCPIADTLPLDFILAECPPFGNNIWRAAYWDDEGWYGEKNLPKSPGKWPVFAD